MKYLSIAVLCLCLSACRLNPGIKSIQDIPIPTGLLSLQDYDSDHNTSYETFAKQMFLSTFYLWDIPEGKTDVEFFVLPEAYKNEAAQYEFYQTALPKDSWREDDAEFLGTLRRWYFQGFRGQQTFVTTYIKLPQSSDALVVRLLYPVNK